MMAYLVSVPLNPLRAGAQRMIENPQVMHAAVEGCLPPRRSGRLLWRLEVKKHEADLLILSPDMPTTDHIVDQAGWPGNEEGQGRVAALSPLLAQIAVGRQYGFRAQLNPVSSQRAAESPTAAQAAKLADGKSIRLAERTVAYQLDWFVKRATGADAQWGFSVGPSVDDANVAIVGRRSLRFTRGRGQPRVSIEVATYEGLLTVTDAERFRRSLLNGIGKAKAYGCGLLTLAPPR